MWSAKLSAALFVLYSAYFLCDGVSVWTIYVRVTTVRVVGTDVGGTIL